MFLIKGENKTMIKEQLQQELLNIIQLSKEGVLKGIDLAQQQAPDLIKQILTYNLYVRWIECIIVGFLFLLTLCITIYYLIRNIKNKYSDADDYFSIVWMSLLPMIFSLIFFYLSLPNLIQIYVAPKLFLLEYIKEFLK
jgi:hypothetical protein